MLMTILIVLLVVSVLGGGFAHSNTGVLGFSPALLVVIILVVLYATGNLG